MMMASQRAIVLCAGGTGGHLFPALALGAVLQARGVRVRLVSDARAKTYVLDATLEMAVLPAATPTRKTMLAKGLAYGVQAKALLKALVLFAKERPRAVVGFGGYPTVAPVLAAYVLRIPVVLHEQNAALGRANAFLLPFAHKLATGFSKVNRLPESYNPRTVVTGNPLRPAVLAAAIKPYIWRETGVVHILVTGGSQGAQKFSTLMPVALSLLSRTQRADLTLTHQCPKGDEIMLAQAYQELGIDARVSPFFSDLPARMAMADLILARSGASTVSEIAALCRPSILVPYPHAIDNDQAQNAQVLADAGGACVFRESDLSPRILSQHIIRAMEDSKWLEKMSHGGGAVRVLNAAERLADVVMAAATGKKERLA